MKARKKKAAQRAAKRTTEMKEKIATNAENKKAEVVDSTEKTTAAKNTTKKEVELPEVKAEPKKEEKMSEIKEEPTEETEKKKVEVKPEPVKEEEKPEVKEEPIKTEKAENTKVQEQEFERRMARHYDELKWLYCELYENRMDMFEDLCKNLKNIYTDRKADLKKQDRVREQDPEWYKKNDILGMMMYVDAFAGNLKGVKEKLDYVQESNVNYLHLMPLLESPEGKSDGGYAVSDFRKVQPELGTMEDLESLADECRKKGISLCMDFVMNHTSEEHEWAKRARAGEREYMDRYYFYDNYDVPSQFEQTVPQVFPTTAPGNFTWLDDMKKFVMTTFYPYQWDLNYCNPRVFNEMMYNFLFLANQGMDVIRIDAVPYIWKELGTPCRNLKQVHTIVRMMRMIAEIVCPSVVLLGEVVMEPEKVVPYFGTVEKPECHMLYNVTTMATTWNSIATRDIRLLKKQMDIVNSLPKQYTFLNYLRCHDDIGWGLDFATLKDWGMDEPSHKRYLNDFFTGKHPGSDSRGELYNDDPVTQDARFCGTTASMCGIEAALFEKDDEKLKRGIREDLMLHAYMLTQSGIPMLYSSDEIGRLNDYSYKEDPDKAADSRYIHRGAFQWELAGNRKSKTSVEGQIFQTLNRMEQIRSQESVFDKDCDVYTYDVHDDSILCILRQKGNDRFIGIFNFSDSEKTAWMQEEGTFRDLITDQTLELKDVELPAYGFMWCKRM